MKARRVRWGLGPGRNPPLEDFAFAGRRLRFAFGRHFAVGDALPEVGIVGVIGLDVAVVGQRVRLGHVQVAAPFGGSLAVTLAAIVEHESEALPRQVGIGLGFVVGSVRPARESSNHQQRPNHRTHRKFRTFWGSDFAGRRRRLPEASFRQAPVAVNSQRSREARAYSANPNAKALPVNEILRRGPIRVGRDSRPVFFLGRDGTGVPSYRQNSPLPAGGKP